jgi:hypothetical protein
VQFPSRADRSPLYLKSDWLHPSRADARRASLSSRKPTVSVNAARCNLAVTLVREETDDRKRSAFCWPDVLEQMALRMDRYGYSIFCDDIRNEAGGKLSFIGCYNGVIFIADPFPLVLPKLCVHVHILSPASRPFNSIVVRCYLPGDDKPFSEEPIETPQRHDQAELVANLKTDTGAPLFIVAATSLIFGPLKLRGPGLMRVRAVIDDDHELRLGSLRIEQAS